MDKWAIKFPNEEIARWFLEYVTVILGYVKYAQGQPTEQWNYHSFPYLIPHGDIHLGLTGATSINGNVTHGRVYDVDIELTEVLKFLKDRTVDAYFAIAGHEMVKLGDGRVKFGCCELTPQDLKDVVNAAHIFARIDAKVELRQSVLYVDGKKIGDVDRIYNQINKGQ